MKISATQLRQDLEAKKSVVLLDVRTPAEFSEAHIDGSILMPLQQLDAAQAKSVLAEKNCHCVIICHGGTRATKAFNLLTQSGCANMSVLEGGVSAWQAANFPVNKAAKSRLPIMRQVQLTIGLCVLVFCILALKVDFRFIYGAMFFGAGMVFAGLTGWCGLACFLAAMPWNKDSKDGSGCGCK